MNCPCGNQQKFDTCCEPAHLQHAHIISAEQLMRARYAAFVVGNIDFVYNTFHPISRRLQNKADIQSWARENKWLQLEIIRRDVEMVEFKAHYLDINLELKIHHEKSKFKKHQDLWYYVDGMIT